MHAKLTILAFFNIITNALKYSGYYMYHQVQQKKKAEFSTHSVITCSHKKV